MATYSDQKFLAADPTLIDRVKQSMITANIAIKNESPTTTPFHRERETYAVAANQQPDQFKLIFVSQVVTNSAVINAATASGTAASFTASIAATGIMTVTAIASGAIVLGQTISGAGVPAGTVVTAFGTGSGGTGTYTVSTTNVIASEAMTAGPTALTAANAAQQATFVGDSLIDTAISTNYNSNFRTPAS